MSKLLTGLILFAIAAALIIGLMASGILVHQDSGVVAAIAEQERAKAARLRAEADEAEARAREAQVEAQAKADALPALAESKRWSALGMGIATIILVVGLAFDLVVFMALRAVTIYPNHQGHWPIVPGRGGWELPGLANGPASLQIATQAQASATMIGVSSVSHANIGEVADRVKRAAQTLPAPVFDTAGNSDGLQLVYVKSGQQQTKAQRERQDIEEFIRRGYVVGFQRSEWLGQKFSGSGNKIMRSYYDTLIRQLARAGVVEDIGGHGWQVIVPLEEALDAFGMAHSDVQNGD